MSVPSDVFPLVCHLLGLSPTPHNGSLSAVGQLLKARPGADRLLQPLLIALGETGRGTHWWGEAGGERVGSGVGWKIFKVVHFKVEDEK